MSIMRGVTPILKAGENAVVEVHGDLSGGVKLVIRDSSRPNGFPVLVTKQIAVALALAILESAGIPIQEAIGRRMIETSGPPLT